MSGTDKKPSPAKKKKTDGGSVAAASAGNMTRGTVDREAKRKVSSPKRGPAVETVVLDGDDASMASHSIASYSGRTVVSITPSIRSKASNRSATAGSKKYK